MIVFRHDLFLQNGLDRRSCASRPVPAGIACLRISRPAGDGLSARSSSQSKITMRTPSRCRRSAQAKPFPVPIVHCLRLSGKPPDYRHKYTTDQSGASILLPHLDCISSGLTDALSRLR
jgi:hypothetical protein